DRRPRPARGGPDAAPGAAAGARRPRRLYPPRAASPRPLRGAAPPPPSPAQPGGAGRGRGARPPGRGLAAPGSAGGPVTALRPVQRTAALAGLALLAGTVAPAADGTRTACGVVLGPATEGIVHPVLPCGAKLYLGYRGRTVLAAVIGRAPSVPGPAFELTRALARRLGLAGRTRIRWSYAGAR